MAMSVNGPSPKVDQQRVVWSVTPDQSRSPYIGDIVGGLRSAGWTVDSLSLRNLASTKGQIVHIQWPEHVSQGPTRAKTAAKHLRAAGLLAAIRLRKHRVVVTAHNIAPHGKSDPFDAWFRSQILSLAEVMVVLVPGHEVELRRLGQVHPNQRIVVSAHPVVPETPQAPHQREAGEPNTQSGLIVLGLIHPYHRILEFVDALIAQSSTRPVHIIGSSADSDLVDELEQRAAKYDWLSISSGYLSDEELAPVVAGAAAVVSLQKVPFNSGAPFFALARNLPVVLTKGSQAADMKEVVGDGWIFEAPTNVQSLDVAALDSWLAQEREAPRLDRYTVEAVATEHIDMYELLLGQQ